MNRVKVPLVAAALLLALGLVARQLVCGRLAAAAAREVAHRVERGYRVLDRNARLEAHEIINLTEQAARRPELGRIFAIADPGRRLDAAFAAVTAERGRLIDDHRPADMVALVDAAGVGVVRDLNVRALAGEALGARYPSIGRALAGTANKDTWSYQGHLWKMAAAPIVSGGAIRGALLLGFQVKASEARAQAELLGTDIAYVLDGRVHASSFVAPGGAEDSTRVSDLAATAFAADGPFGGRLLDRARSHAPAVGITLGGERYVAAAGPLQGNIVNQTSGAVVCASLDRALEPARTAGLAILGMALLGVLVCLAAVVATSWRFQRPIDRLESGVAEVINGNLEFTFSPVGRDLEGLANQLNVMLARLLGRPDPDSDEEGAAGAEGAGAPRGWGLLVDDGSAAAAAAGGAPAVDATTLALAHEPESDYLQRLFGEYLAARRIAGQRDDGLTLEAFTAKLRESEVGLVARYGCRAVRFRVVSASGQVTLKPVPIYT